MFRIVTHNAYWFQGKPSLWGDERQQPHPDLFPKLLDFYQNLQPDLLCLQEVPGFAAYKELERRLGMHGDYVAGATFAAYGNAILVNPSTVIEIKDHSRTEIDVGRLFERSCISGTIASLDNLKVVNHHACSPRYAMTDDLFGHRQVELEAVVALTPHVIVGDLNFRRNTPNHDFLRKQGFVDTGTMNDKGGGTRNWLTDYIWVQKSLADKARGCKLIDDASFRVCIEDREHQLSDHFPVVTDFDW